MKLLHALAVVVSIGACSLAPASGQSEADRALLRLLEQDYDAQLRRDPIGASNRGDRRFDRRLPDVSPVAVRAEVDDARRRLGELEAIDRAALSADNRLNAELFEVSLRDFIDAARFHPEQFAVGPQSGPQIELPQIPDRISFTTRAHYDDYLARLEAIPAYLDQTIENLRAGLAAGRTPARVTLLHTPAQAGAMAAGAFLERPETHPLFRPFLSLPEGDELAVRASEALRARVLPALARLRDFLRDEYAPGAVETLGATALPDGKDYYAFLVRHFTTTPLTPEEIHQIGLSEVARIRSEMMRVIDRTDFEGRPRPAGDALFNAFVERLRTDSRFYHARPEDLLTGYRDICKRMDAELPSLFGKLPRLSYGVREMPAFMSAAAPTAYYYPGSMRGGVAGNFVANVHRLDQRPKYEMVALALHEAVPGHHLQTALADELREAGLPQWRSLFSSTAYVEGWALYSEKLGLEVPGARGPAGTVFGGGTGMYEDPYDDFGRLSYEMWRALRLVVDTGIHAFGWSRERAIEYMLANSALTRQNVESEVDRYIAWPGQALAYKIGELKIMELRRLAEKELGERFDRRAFHDAIIETGPVPLTTLERHVRAWIDSAKAPPTATGRP
jgi:uncharacterized protein (DUF885 family)